jgi:hypothetical protein
VVVLLFQKEYRNGITYQGGNDWQLQAMIWPVSDPLEAIML